MGLFNLFKSKIKETTPLSEKMVFNLRPPKGYKTIENLTVSTENKEIVYKVDHWRLIPGDEYEPGSLFVWLKMGSKREPFFFNKQESLCIDTDPTASHNFNELKVVLRRGKKYVLKVVRELGDGRMLLPPPPRKFPPVGV